MTLLSVSPSDYVLSLSLPEVGPRFEAASAPLEFSNRREAVAVGAQLAEFADTVAVELRAPIADSILLAQLAASLVVSVLKGLNEMDASTPWIALFERASQHAHGAKFQVSYVDVGADGQPEITLICFGIHAERTIVQVLFFKFSQQSAELKTGTGRVRISMQRLNSAKEAIASRVQAFVGEFVQNIDI